MAKPWIVLYYLTPPPHVPSVRGPRAFSCNAEAEPHAVHQLRKWHPDADIVWTQPGTSAVAAMAEYVNAEPAPAPAQTSNDESDALKDLLMTTLSMLRDLDNGASWRDLVRPLPEVMARAKALGVPVEEFEAD